MTTPGPCWCAGQMSHHADGPCPERDHWLDVDDSELDEPTATREAKNAERAAARDADRRARGAA
jgi:hypothetical protein